MTLSFSLSTLESYVNGLQFVLAISRTMNGWHKLRLYKLPKSWICWCIHREALLVLEDSRGLHFTHCNISSQTGPNSCWPLHCSMMPTLLVKMAVASHAFGVEELSTCSVPCMCDHLVLFLECDWVAYMPTQAAVFPVPLSYSKLDLATCMPPAMCSNIMHISTAIADADNDDRFISQWHSMGNLSQKIMRSCLEPRIFNSFGLGVIMRSAPLVFDSVTWWLSVIHISCHLWLAHVPPLAWVEPMHDANQKHVIKCNNSIIILKNNVILSRGCQVSN